MARRIPWYHCTFSESHSHTSLILINDFMNLYVKRHFSSLSSSSFTKESQLRNLCQSGSLSAAIQALNSAGPQEIAVKSTLYASLLQTCVKAVAFRPGLQLHAHVVKSGLETDRFVGNSLLSLHLKLGSSVSEARRVFDNLVVKDVVSWTSMVSGYVKVGRPRIGIGLFREMSGFGVDPNGFTLSAVIKACSDLQDLRLGRCFHAMVSKRGFDSNDVIASSLVDMYGRNHVPEDARRVFDDMPEPDVVCWTSVISAMTRNGSFGQALALFYSMQRDSGVSGDGITFGTVLTACGNLRRLNQGKELHSAVIARGFRANVFVESSLVDMYGKCGSVDKARRAFDVMKVKNCVTWSALLGVYCQNGWYESAIDIFRQMQEDEKEEFYNFGTVLRACAGLAAARLGKEVHCRYLRRRIHRDVIVESALVDLYAKCGCIDFARCVFAQMTARNLITWNSMICGLAQNGRGLEATGLIDKMTEEGVEPDYVTFVGVLSACSHSGLVEEGKRHFDSMKREHGIKPGHEHYNCMVDLLGRAGLLEEAESLIESVDCEKKSSLWAALLGACTSCAESSPVAERVAKRVMELEPGCHLSYVLLGNVYRAMGRWNDALSLRKLMRDRGVKKIPGKSWIESDIGLDTRFRRPEFIECS